MNLKGTIGKLEDVGDAVHATLVNVRSVSDAGWREYCPSLVLRISNYHTARQAYYIGRSVSVTVNPI